MSETETNLKPSDFLGLSENTGKARYYDKVDGAKPYSFTLESMMALVHYGITQ